LSASLAVSPGQALQVAVGGPGGSCTGGQGGAGGLGGGGAGSTGGSVSGAGGGGASAVSFGSASPGFGLLLVAGGGGAGGSAPLPGGGGSSFISGYVRQLSAPRASSQPPGVQITYTYPVPQAQLAPSSLSFGTVPQGIASAQRTLTLTNSGSAKLLVSAVLIGRADPGDFLVSENSCRQPVAPGANRTIGVRFAPQAQGARTASLQLQTNAPAQPLPISLSGVGGSLPAGPQGPPGPKGSAATVALLSCAVAPARHSGRRRAGGRQRPACRMRTISGALIIRAFGAVQPAALTRGATLYGRGQLITLAHGRSEIVLVPARRITPGRYTLALSVRRGHRSITRGQTVTITAPQHHARHGKHHRRRPVHTRARSHRPARRH